MRVYQEDGKQYKLPNELNDFQLKLYMHQIDWKRQHITDEPGLYKGERYDAILPDSARAEDKMPHIYPTYVNHLAEHRKRNPFRLHPHFYHMSSSQAANINLFLPVLHHPSASAILSGTKAAPADFKSVAFDLLDHGYCLEYWGGNYNAGIAGRGPLSDKSSRAGTDADIAIAYHDSKGDLCLWLIEHKLREHEFTKCGGYESKGRKDKQRHDCTRSFTQILENKSTCYYHDNCGYSYWNITEANRDFFPGHDHHAECPFKGGMNQLWRNQLLGLAIEQAENQPYKHVHFSVVHHPDNEALEPTLNAYRKLIGNNPKFSVFTSADFIMAARKHADTALREWIDWYVDLYMITQPD